MNQQLLTKMAVMVLLLSTLATLPFQKASAVDSEKVTVTMHKLLFEEGKLPAEDAIKNDGTLNPEGKELLKNYSGVNDVTFSAYDVTDEFYALRGEGKSVEEAQQAVASSVPKTESIQTQTTSKVNNEDGIANFSLESKDEQGRDKAYVFLETGLPAEVKTAAKPIALVLPVVGKDQQRVTTIHLFPKNERRSGVPTLRKVINTDRNNFSYGETIPFKIETTVPDDVRTYQVYTLEDYADESLWLVKKNPVEASVKATLSGSDRDDFYTVTRVSDHGFLITFKPEKLREAVGKTITVTYDMILKNQKNSSSTFVNTTVLVPGNHTIIQKKKETTTGGKRFVKVNLKDQNQHLSGAKFIVSNTKGQYLREKAGRYEWVSAKGTLDDALKNQLLLLTSDQQGAFEIKGLAYGKYQLTEVAAPDGYVKNTSPIDFVVEAGSYEAGAALALKVVNEPAKTPPPTTSSTNTPPGTEPPTDSGNHYPKTNEQRNPGLIFVGISLLVTGCALLIWHKKMKN